MKINSELNISFDEVLRYTGFNNELHKLDDDMILKIQKNIDLVKKTIRPRAVVSAAINIEEINEAIMAGGTLLLSGSDIKAHLKNCHSIIIMGTTLGNEIDALIRRMEVSDMSDAVILDAASNVAIEEFSSNYEDAIRDEIRLENKYLTMRYSPGYGNLPINIQSELVRVIDGTRKIGLTVTPSHIMIPRKSVTSIMGVADIDVKGKLAGCANCVMKDKCVYRKRGTTCA